MTARRKQIAFDLDTRALKQYYPNGVYENAYYEIRRFMTQNSFIWQQGSVYVSQLPVSIAKAIELIKKLANEQPWLKLCMRDCAVTNIGKTHLLNHLFEKDARILSCEEMDANKEKKSTQADRPSVKAQLAAAREEILQRAADGVPVKETREKEKALER